MRGCNLWIPQLLELPLPSCSQLLQSCKNSELKSAWHPHKVLLAISANSGAKCWPLCSQLTTMTENLGRISHDHWHLDLTKAEWLLSCYTRKKRHFATDYLQLLLRIPDIRPLPQRSTHSLCAENIKNIKYRQTSKNYVCSFQYNLLSILCISVVFCFQLCNFIYFFLLSSWGTSKVQTPKYIDLVIKSALFLFWKPATDLKENIWKHMKDNS